MLERLIEYIAVNQLGDLASVVGVVIAVLGFGATLWRMSKIKRAAEAAKNAALTMRENMMHMDTVTKCAAAIEILDEIRRLHRTTSWHILPDRYSVLKRSLIEIRKTSPALGEAQKSKIQGAISHVARIESSVESALADNTNEVNVPRINRLVAKQIEAMTEILADIKSRIQ